MKNECLCVINGLEHTTCQFNVSVYLQQEHLYVNVTICRIALFRGKGGTQICDTSVTMFPGGEVGEDVTKTITGNMSDDEYDGWYEEEGDWYSHQEEEQGGR